MKKLNLSPSSSGYTSASGVNVDWKFSKMVTSCWKLNLKERVRVFLTGKVFISEWVQHKGSN